MGGEGRGNRKSPLENTIKIKHSTEKAQKRLPLKITDFCSFFKNRCSWEAKYNDAGLQIKMKSRM